MEKNKVNQIIKEIFEPFLLGDEFPKHVLNAPPTFNEIKEFAKLILEDESEESFQKYISKHPHFLFRLAPSTDDTNLGLLVKPPISNFNTADYGILSVSQGGCRIFLVEIERPSDNLFTNKLTPAQKLQTAIGQVHDWDQWIRNNQQAFVNTCFKLLKNSSKYPQKGKNGSFIYCDKNKLENTWNAFGGSEFCTLQYLIVIGRWSKLSEDQKKRLMYLNRNFGELNLRIRTYDNLVRKAIDGPKFLW